MKYTAKIVIYYSIEAENCQEAHAKVMIDATSVDWVARPLIPTIRMTRGYYYSEGPESETIKNCEGKE